MHLLELFWGITLKCVKDVISRNARNRVSIQVVNKTTLDGDDDVLCALYLVKGMIMNIL